MINYESDFVVMDREDEEFDDIHDIDMDDDEESFEDPGLEIFEDLEITSDDLN